MKLLLLLIGILFISGCATSYNVKPIAQDGTEVQFQKGSECLISNKTSIATLAPKDGTNFRSKRRASFIVAVKNESTKKYNFSHENIRVEYIGQDGAKIPLNVLSYDELVAEEQRRQAWAAVGAGLQAMGDSMNAANAGYSNTYGSYSGNSYSNYGNSYQHSGTFSAQTYDYGAAQAAQNAARAKSDANFRRIADDARRNNAHLANTILRKHTVMPQQWHGGEIQFNLPSLTPSGYLSFKVETSREIHSFKFNISKENVSYRNEVSDDENLINQNEKTKTISENKTKTITASQTEETKNLKKELLWKYIRKEITKDEYAKRMKTLNEVE